LRAHLCWDAAGIEANLLFAHGLGDVGRITEEIEIPADIVLCRGNVSEGLVVEGIATFFELVAESVVGLVKV